MRILVQKFGGTALENIERIKQATNTIRSGLNEGYAVVVVASAMGDATDTLLELSKPFDARKSKREMDLLLSTGEQISASLLAMALNSNNILASVFAGWQAGVITDETFGAACIKRIQTSNLLKCLKQGRVAVVTGYQGISESGALTTLGRGGSDTTAVALAAALKAERCDIFTDVDGIYSCDPRLCQNTVKYEQITFFEMFNFAKAGAQVMSTSSMEIAASKNVQLRVRSAFEMNDLGTLISRAPKASGFVGIACDKQQQIFSCKSADNLAELTKLQDFKSKAADYGIEPEVICRVGRKNSHKAYFSISNRHVHNAAEILKEVAEDLNLPFEYERSLAKVSLIAEGRNTNDIVNRLFSCLIHQRICPRFWSVESGIRVSVWIRNAELQEAAEVLHRTFVKEAVSVSA